MLKMIRNIARTELQMLFYSPIAWLILIVFTIQAGVLFSEQFSRMVSNQAMGYNISGSSLYIFAYPWGGVLTGIQGYLYYYIPLLTMSLVSRELSTGSIKLLYSSPITNIQIIVGKFASVMVYGIVMMSILLLLWVVGFTTIKHFDWPAVLTGILGLYLLVCAYGAIGIFMSSLTSYQIVAAIGTFAVLMVLNMVGGWWQDYDLVRDITYWLSIKGRSGTFIQGLICSEDILYFLILVALFLALTVIRLNAVRQKVRLSITLGRNFVVILFACLLGYFSSLPSLKVYYDSTETKQNTLTPNSQEVVSKLDGKLTITTYINMLDQGASWYAAGHFLKPDMNRFEKYLRFKPDMKLKYVYYYDTTYNPQLDKRYPDLNLREKMVELCKIYGIDSNKFKTPEEIRSIIDLSGEGNTFVRQIVRENGEKAWLRIYNDMQKFPSEREITAAFKRMVMRLPVVGFLTGHGERGFISNKDRDYSLFANDKKFRYSLTNQGFDVEYVSLDKEIPEYINILVIAESKDKFSASENEYLQRYIDRGGNLLVLGEPKRRDEMNPLFAKFGFELMEGQLVKQDTNLQADVVLSYPTEEADSIAYDFAWMRRYEYVIVTEGVCGLRQIEDKGYNVIELFRSDTTGSWNELETVDFIDDTVCLNPLVGEIERSYPTLVALTRQVGDREQRIILSGDADCISNSGLMGKKAGIQSSNYTFIMGGFFWLSNNEAPIDVRRPRPSDNKIYITTSSGVSVVKWSLVLVLPLLLLGGGVFTWIRRKGR